MGSGSEMHGGCSCASLLFHKYCSILYAHARLQTTLLSSTTSQAGAAAAVCSVPIARQRPLALAPPWPDVSHAAKIGRVS